MKKNIVIFGGTGFIGESLLRILQRNFFNVFDISLPHYDLSKEPDVEKIKKTLPINPTLIHLAEIKKQHGDSADNLINNINIAKNICSIIDSKKIDKFIYISSAAVYGEESNCMNLSESSPFNPSTYYGIGKLSSEFLLRNFCASKGIKFLSLRPPLVYGLADKSRSYGPTEFFYKAVKNEPINLWGDGSELREFIYVDDLSNVIEYLIDSKFDGVINIASGISYSYAQAIKYLKVFFPTLTIKSKPRTKAKIDIRFDSNNFFSVLPKNFTFTSLEKGFLIMYNNYLNDRRGYNK